MKFRKETWHVDRGVEKETCRLSQRHVYFHSTNDDGFLCLSPAHPHTLSLPLSLHLSLAQAFSLFLWECLFLTLSVLFRLYLWNSFSLFPHHSLTLSSVVTSCLDHQRQTMGSLSLTIALSLSLFVSWQPSDIDRLSRLLSYSSCLHKHDGIDGPWCLCLCV